MGIALLIMSEHAKLQELCGKSYKQQAVWFLNCFWEQFAEKEAELFWNYVQKNAELDLENHEQGAALDEMKAHVFLEKFETLTVRAMREKLRSTGALGETERPKVVPLTHYLLYKYNADWKLLVDETRQGSNKEEMEKAEAMLREVQAAFADAQQKASTAKKAFLEAQSAEASAKSAESAAVARDTSAKASAETAKTREIQAQKDAEAAKAREAEAKQELEAALAEVKAQEDAYNQKKAELERKSTEGGVVSQNKAKAELAQHLAEDPLPLRRAKITQEAAVKKAERATKAAAEAVVAAENAAKQATEDRAAAEKAARAEATRAEKDAAAASSVREAASAARAEAERARAASEKAKAAADAARAEAER